MKKKIPEQEKKFPKQETSYCTFSNFTKKSDRKFLLTPQDVSDMIQAVKKY